MLILFWTVSGIQENSRFSSKQPFFRKTQCSSFWFLSCPRVKLYSSTVTVPCCALASDHERAETEKHFAETKQKPVKEDVRSRKADVPTGIS
ncbi:hypothetical protein GN956_G22718 [Arapaima gigas]